MLTGESIAIVVAGPASVRPLHIFFFRKKFTGLKISRKSSKMLLLPQITFERDETSLNFCLNDHRGVTIRILKILRFLILSIYFYFISLTWHHIGPKFSKLYPIF